MSSDYTLRSRVVYLKKLRSEHLKHQNALFLALNCVSAMFTLIENMYRNFSYAWAKYL